MIRRCSVLLTGALLWLAPRPALAHGALEGAGDFYAGLLHPVVVPAELLALVATGLLIGRAGLATCRWAIPMLAGGVAVGLAAAHAVDALSGATTALIVFALAAAAIVTTGLRAPMGIGVGLASLTGVAVGFDAAPEPNAWFTLLLTAAATLLGSTAIAAILAALALKAEQHWQRIAVQIAGSWITASALLYLAYQFMAPAR